MNWLSQSEGTVTLRPQRSLGGITFDVVVEEQHEDTLEITEHPVEHGASISDHAFMKPAAVTIRAGVSDGSGSVAGEKAGVSVYEALQALQKAREPFDIITGKRKYRNMLIETLTVLTDADSENALVVTAECREVIIVKTRTTSVPPRSRHRNAGKTGGTANKGQKQAKQGSVIQNTIGTPGQGHSRT